MIVSVAAAAGGEAAADADLEERLNNLRREWGEEGIRAGGGQ